MFKYNLHLFFFFTYFFIQSCSQQENNTLSERDYINLNYKLFSINEMVNYFDINVDGFENDTTFISEKFNITPNQSDVTPAIIYLDYTPRYKNASLHILLNKSISKDYCQANFKLADNTITRLFSRVINYDDLTLLDFWINDKEKYLTLKNLFNNDSLLFRAGNYDDTEMIITKNQLKGLDMFLLFIDKRGLFEE